MERRKPCPAENLAQGKNNLLRESDEQDRQKLSAISGIQLGRKLIIAGFTISTAGIVTYCLFGFTSGNGLDISTLGLIGLAIIAVGTAFWFAGAFKYFHSAVEANLPDELFF